jgi:hypothetical protein
MSKAWAHELARRARRLERLTLAQRTMWRAALGRAAEPQAVNGEFEAMPEEKLPPGMRTERDESGRPVPPT